jgi:cytosine/adenosine deaminase-related metal-dependent hydrolase
VVYPAWVNTHHHLFQSLLKGEPQGINATLTPWLAATPYRFRRAFDEATFRLAARVGLVELALSGCATVADHNYMYYPGQAFDPSAILFDEAQALGLRFVLCRGGETRLRPGISDQAGKLRPETIDEYMTDIERLAARYHDASPAAMRRIVVAPTTPTYSMPPEEIRDCARTNVPQGSRHRKSLARRTSVLDAGKIHGVDHGEG